MTNLALSLHTSLAPGERLTLLGDLASMETPDDSLSAVEFHSVPVPVSPFGASQQWRVPILLRRLPSSGPALYHSPYFLFPYRTGMPTVLTFYDVTPLLYPQTVSLKARIFFRIAATVALRAASLILTVSEATRADLTRNFSVQPQKISLTPLAADPRFNRNPLLKSIAFRAKYDLPTRFVLYFGSNKPHKNLPALIDAFAQLSARHSPPLIIGGFWDRRYRSPDNGRHNFDLVSRCASSARSMTPTCPRSTARPLFLFFLACTKDSACRCWKRCPAGRRWPAPTHPACLRSLAQPPGYSIPTLWLKSKRQ